MTQRIEHAVLTALAHQLQLDRAAVHGARDRGLDELGLDSHGLMRVLLDIEKSLGLSTPLELLDDALATPATLVAGVAVAIG